MFRTVAQEAGFEVGGTLDKLELRKEGLATTIFIFTSIGGSLTGEPIDGVCVVDDPIKDREDARSASKRRALRDWWATVARTRRHPGTSYIVMATRWPGGDLTDHLTKKEGWQYINLKAIATGAVNDNGIVIDDPLGRRPGESLSKRKPPEFFKEDRADLFWWASLYQGEPTKEGGKIFADPGDTDEDGKPIGPRYYRELPKAGYVVGFGVDLAYSAKTSSDFSVVIKALFVPDEGKLYLVKVIRRQTEAPKFLGVLSECKDQNPGAIFRFYGSGTEKGSASFIRRRLGRVFLVINASADKLVRATPASVTWNLGDILLPDPEVFPEAAEWLEDFLETVTNFTGTPGERDDDVDALAAVHDQLTRKRRGGLEALRKANI